MNDLLQPRIVRMPAFPSTLWLNSPPLNKEGLRGSVVLVDFWDYSCINCLRTLPYLKAWHERYADKGLTIIGVHAPEFKFGRDRAQIEAAVKTLDIHYPILLDNDYEVWQQFAVKAWPTKILVDVDSYIRYQRRGEGYYEETEKAIQALLKEGDDGVELPALMPAIRREDKPEAVCYKPTPELHAGYATGLLGSGLGNEEGHITGMPFMYIAPGQSEREFGRFYLGGFWQAHSEFAEFAGNEIGKVFLAYEGVSVNAVLSPSGDDVALRLGLASGEVVVSVEQDGCWLDGENAGKDIQFDEHGQSYLTINRPRLYELVKNPGFGFHDLELTFHTPQTALYAFAFTSCVII